MLVWDVTCPDIFTPSYTNMEVGVASSSRAKDENFKISDYFYHTFFISIRTELRGVFYLYQT